MSKVRCRSEGDTTFQTHFAPRSSSYRSEGDTPLFEDSRPSIGSPTTTMPGGDRRSGHSIQHIQPWSAFSNAIQNGTDPVDYVYRPWGAFNRPPRWPWHPHHGTVVTYSSPDGVVHAPPSLALTLRQATCQRLDWRLCRGLRSLPRAAG